eukprot:ANDGO_00533.mRNA.1 hypothetical protein
MDHINLFSSQQIVRENNAPLHVAASLDFMFSLFSDGSVNAFSYQNTENPAYGFRTVSSRITAAFGLPHVNGILTVEGEERNECVRLYVIAIAKAQANGRGKGGIPLAAGVSGIAHVVALTIRPVPTGACCISYCSKSLLLAIGGRSLITVFQLVIPPNVSKDSDVKASKVATIWTADWLVSRIKVHGSFLSYSDGMSVRIVTLSQACERTTSPSTQSSMLNAHGASLPSSFSPVGISPTFVSSSSADNPFTVCYDDGGRMISKKSDIVPDLFRGRRGSLADDVLYPSRKRFLRNVGHPVFFASKGQFVSNFVLEMHFSDGCVHSLSMDDELAFICSTRKCVIFNLASQDVEAVIPFLSDSVCAGVRRGYFIISASKAGLEVWAYPRTSFLRRLPHAFMKYQRPFFVCMQPLFGTRSFHFVPDDRKILIFASIGSAENIALAAKFDESSVSLHQSNSNRHLRSWDVIVDNIDFASRSNMRSGSFAPLITGNSRHRPSSSSSEQVSKVPIEEDLFSWNVYVLDLVDDGELAQEILDCILSSSISTSTSTMSYGQLVHSCGLLFRAALVGRSLNRDELFYESCRRIAHIFFDHRKFDLSAFFFSLTLDDVVGTANVFLAVSNDGGDGSPQYLSAPQSASHSPVYSVVHHYLSRVLCDGSFSFVDSVFTSTYPSLDAAEADRFLWMFAKHNSMMVSTLIFWSSCFAASLETMLQCLFSTYGSSVDVSDVGALDVDKLPVLRPMDVFAASILLARLGNTGLSVSLLQSTFDEETLISLLADRFELVMFKWDLIPFFLRNLSSVFISACLRLRKHLKNIADIVRVHQSLDISYMNAANMFWRALYSHHVLDAKWYQYAIIAASVSIATSADIKVIVDMDDDADGSQFKESNDMERQSEWFLFEFSKETMTTQCIFLCKLLNDASSDAVTGCSETVQTALASLSNPRTATILQSLLQFKKGEQLEAYLSLRNIDTKLANRFLVQNAPAITSWLPILEAHGSSMSDIPTEGLQYISHPSIILESTSEQRWQLLDRFLRYKKSTQILRKLVQ